jgi:hypothetical protein
MDKITLRYLVALKASHGNIPVWFFCMLLVLPVHSCPRLLFQGSGVHWGFTAHPPVCLCAQVEH